MRLDNLIIRLSAVMGAKWLQAYALIKCKPEVDVEKFRFEVPKRLKMHHETEKYVGGVPGDLFIGFFAKGQSELFDEIGQIKSWNEVLEVTEFAVANFPVNKVDLTKLDWQIVKALRGGADKTAWQIAKEIGVEKELVAKQLAFIKSIPLAFSIEAPNRKAWKFVEIQIDFTNTTFKEKMGELTKIGKPFGAAGSWNQGAIMVKPKTIDELQDMIRATSEIPGVKVIGYAFCEDLIWTQPWLDRFIDEQIAALS